LLKIDTRLAARAVWHAGALVPLTRADLRGGNGSKPTRIVEDTRK